MLPHFKFTIALPVLALCFLTLLVTAPQAPAAAQGAGARPGGKGEVTKITSDSMVYDSAKRLVTFRGKVRVVQPDFTQTSDSLELHLSGQSGGGKPGASMSPDMQGGEVEKIIARNNVTIRLPDGRSASCQKATYTTQDEVLVMEGNPVLREESNVLSADLIRFYLKENRSTAHGNVKVDFTAKGDGKSGAGAQ